VSDEFFKESDCDVCSLPAMVGNKLQGSIAAISLDKANRLLKERGTVVWGWDEDGIKKQFTSSNDGDPALGTHTALLINVQPIEKPKCPTCGREAKSGE
jgi:hypothetical protein